MRARCLPLAVLALLAPAAAAQTTWFVDDDNCPGGTGTSLDPFCSVQQAVDAASAGDRVLVSPGTYGCVDYKGKDLVVQSLEGPAVTRISGALFLSGESAAAVLDGFRIGGGCFPVENSVRLSGSSPTISNNELTSNLVFNGGGALYMFNGSAPRVLFNLFQFNTCGPTTGIGGAVYASASSPYFEGNVFRNNSVFADYGQGLGGAVYLSGSNATFLSNLFDRNSAGDENRNQGGAVFARNSTLKFFGNTFTGNTSADAQLPAIGPGEGGALYLESCVTTLASNIFWGDHATVGPEIATSAGVVNLSYSTVDQGLPQLAGTATVNWGPGMRTADPLLDGSSHLSAGSPALEAGAPTWELGGQDGDGEPRKLDGDADGVARLDMGWDEVDPTGLFLTGDGTLGTNLDLTTTGLASQLYTLAASTGTGDLPFRAFGSILLSLSGFQRIGGGTVPGTHSIPIPPSTSLVGLRVYFQAIALTPGAGIGSFSRRIAVTLH